MVVAAGLPNIQGTFKSCIRDYSAPTGVFTDSYYQSNRNGENGNTTVRTYTFNANRSSSIYGNSNTVQPPAIQLIAQIKY